MLFCFTPFRSKCPKEERNYIYYKADTQILKYVQITAKNAYKNISKVKKRHKHLYNLKSTRPNRLISNFVLVRLKMTC